MVGYDRRGLTDDGSCLETVERDTYIEYNRLNPLNGNGEQAPYNE